MDQLRRETQPPAGTPPSPVPQYWNPDADQYERVQGAHGAPRAILYGPNGQPISSANRLPVEASVTGEVSITGEVSVAGEVSLSEAADISDRPGRQLGEVTLSGTTAEIASARYEETLGTTRMYTRAPGASRIEVYVETGYVRIRTDGDPCTATTGEPLGQGFAAMWAVENISVFYVQDSTITVVSR